MAPYDSAFDTADLIHDLEVLQESAQYALLTEGKKAAPAGYCKAMGKSKVYIYIKTDDPKDPWKHFATPGTPKGDAALAKSAAWDKAAEKADEISKLAGKALTSPEDVQSLDADAKKKLQTAFGDFWPESVSETLDDLDKLEGELTASHSEWMAAKGKPKEKAPKGKKTAPEATPPEEPSKPDLSGPPPAGADDETPPKSAAKEPEAPAEPPSSPESPAAIGKGAETVPAPAVPESEDDLDAMVKTSLPKGADPTNPADLTKHLKGTGLDKAAWFVHGDDWASKLAQNQKKLAGSKEEVPELPKGHPAIPSEIPDLSVLKHGGDAAGLGGMAQKDFYVGPDGKKYLFKKAIDASGDPKHFAAVAAEVVGGLSSKIKGYGIPVKRVTLGGTVGTLQPMVDLDTPSDLKGIAPDKLSKDEKIAVAREHVLDWMTGQHDSHAGNFLRLKGGGLVGIDKEQAFRFFGDPGEKLSTDYSPNPDTPYYNGFWKAFEQGKLGDFDPKSMYPAIRRAMSIPDDEYKAKLETYYKSLPASVQKKKTTFIQDAIKRKNSLEGDFEKFLTGLYQKKDGAPKGVFTFAHGWSPSGTFSEPNLKPAAAPEPSAATPADEPEPEQNPDDIPVWTPSEEELDAMAAEMGGNDPLPDPSDPLPPEAPAEPGKPSLPGPVALPSMGWPASNYSELADLVKQVSAGKGKTSDAMLAKASDPSFIKKYGPGASDAINAVRVALGKPAYLKLPDKTLTQGELESIRDAIGDDPEFFKVQVAGGAVKFSKEQLHAANAMLALKGHGPIGDAAPPPAVVPPSGAEGLVVNGKTVDLAAHPVPDAMLDLKSPPSPGEVATVLGDINDMALSGYASWPTQKWLETLKDQYGPDWKTVALHAIAKKLGYSPEDIPELKATKPATAPAAEPPKPATAAGELTVDPKDTAGITGALASIFKEPPGDWSEGLDDIADMLDANGANGTSTKWVKALKDKYGAQWKQAALKLAALHTKTPEGKVPGLSKPASDTPPGADPGAHSSLAQALEYLQGSSPNKLLKNQPELAKALQTQYGDDWKHVLPAAQAALEGYFTDVTPDLKDPVAAFKGTEWEDDLAKNLGPDWQKKLDPILKGVAQAKASTPLTPHEAASFANTVSYPETDLDVYLQHGTSATSHKFGGDPVPHLMGAMMAKGIEPNSKHLAALGLGVDEYGALKTLLSTSVEGGLAGKKSFADTMADPLFAAAMKAAFPIDPDKFKAVANAYLASKGAPLIPTDPSSPAASNTAGMKTISPGVAVLDHPEVKKAFADAKTPQDLFFKLPSKAPEGTAADSDWKFKAAAQWLSQKGFSEQEAQLLNGDYTSELGSDVGPTTKLADVYDAVGKVQSDSSSATNQKMTAKFGKNWPDLYLQAVHKAYSQFVGPSKNLGHGVTDGDVTTYAAYNLLNPDITPPEWYNILKSVANSPPTSKYGKWVAEMKLKHGELWKEKLVYATASKHAMTDDLPEGVTDKLGKPGTMIASLFSEPEAVSLFPSGPSGMKLGDYSKLLILFDAGYSTAAEKKFWGNVQDVYGSDWKQEFLNDMAAHLKETPPTAPPTLALTPQKSLTHPGVVPWMKNVQTFFDLKNPSDFADIVSAIYQPDYDEVTAEGSPLNHDMVEGMKSLHGESWPHHMAFALSHMTGQPVPAKAAQALAGSAKPEYLDLMTADEIGPAGSAASISNALEAYLNTGGYPGVESAAKSMGPGWADKLGVLIAAKHNLPIEPQVLLDASNAASPAAPSVSAMGKLGDIEDPDHEMALATLEQYASDPAALSQIFAKLSAADQSTLPKYWATLVPLIKGKYGVDVEGFAKDLPQYVKLKGLGTGIALPKGMEPGPKTTASAPIPSDPEEAKLYSSTFHDFASAAIKTALNQPLNSFVELLNHSYPPISYAESLLGPDYKAKLAKAYQAKLTTHYAPLHPASYSFAADKGAQSKTIAKKLSSSYLLKQMGVPYAHDCLKAALMAANKKTVLANTSSLFKGTLTDSDQSKCFDVANDLIAASKNANTFEEAVASVLTPSKVKALKAMGPAWPHVVNTYLTHYGKPSIPHLPEGWMDPSAVDLSGVDLTPKATAPAAATAPKPTGSPLTAPKVEPPPVAPKAPPPPPAQVKSAVPVVSKGVPPAAKVEPKDPAPSGFKPAPAPAAKEAPKVGSIPSLPAPAAVKLDTKVASKPLSPEANEKHHAAFLASGSKPSYVMGADGNQWIASHPVSKTGEPLGPSGATSASLFHKVAAFVKPGLAYGKGGPDHVVLHTPHKLGDPPTLADVPPSSLTESEQEDLAGEHVLDWMMGHHDSHGAAFVRTADGRILGTAKTHAFAFGDEDRLSTDYLPHGKDQPEPYYNRFWKDWAAGKHDFDPMKLKAHMDSLDSIDPVGYSNALHEHFAALYPGQPERIYDGVQTALYRKASVRAEFERFLTDLYRQRTGEAKGRFDFDDGWVPKPAEPYEVSVPLKEHAPTMGVTAHPYQDYSKTPPAPDTTKLTLKVPKTSDINAVVKMLTDAGVTVHGAPVVGSYNSMVFVDKAAYESADSGKTKTVVPAKAATETPKKPRYFPKVYKPGLVTKTSKNLADVEKHQFHYTGQVFHMDSDAVEGQAVKIRKVKSGKGYSYEVSFKLRKPEWQGLAAQGTASTYSFKQGVYDPSEGVLSPTSGNSDSVSTRKWESEGHEVHLAHDSHKFAYMGSVYVKLKPKKGETVEQALKAALDGVKPGLAQKVMSAPTEQDKEIARLSRLYWAYNPQGADSLAAQELKTPGVRTVASLKKALMTSGVTEDMMAQVVEREVYPGHFTHVLPGRAKQMKARMMFQGIGDLTGAVNIAQVGIMGIHERNHAGLPQFGGSYDADVASGSGDGTLCRVVTDAGMSHKLSSHAFSGAYQAIIAPDELDRLDAYYYDSDTYGRCTTDSSAWKNRKSVKDGIDALSKTHHSGNEISFRKGINRGRILRLACQSESAREQFIQKAKASGLHEVNGIPVEDFCVVTNNLGETYDKYVKPLGY